MKKIKTIFSTMLLCVSLMAAFTSCSDDDDNDAPAPPAAKSIEGTYTGDMSCSVMGQESTFENMTFTLTAIDDATVKITISEFGNPPMKVSSISIDGVKVSGADGNYTLAATDFKGETSGKAYSGTAQGSFANNQLTIKFNLQYGAMPMPMICSFTAPKK